MEKDMGQLENLFEKVNGLYQVVCVMRDDLECIGTEISATLKAMKTAALAEQALADERKSAKTKPPTGELDIF